MKRYSVLYWSSKVNHPDTVIVRASSAEGAQAAASQLDDCKFVLGVEEIPAASAEPPVSKGNGTKRN